MALQFFTRSTAMRMALPCSRLMPKCGWSAMNTMEARVDSKLHFVQAQTFSLPMSIPALEDRLLTETVKVELPGVENQQAMHCVNTRKQLRRWKYRRKRDGGKDRKFRLKYGWGSESFTVEAVEVSPATDVVENCDSLNPAGLWPICCRLLGHRHRLWMLGFGTEKLRQQVHQFHNVH